VSQEETRENKRLAQEKYYLGKLVEGPVLELPLTGAMNFSFNPNNLFSLGKYGTVYPTITMTDDWGRLVVTANALISTHWKSLCVSIPHGIDRTGTSVREEGWQLEIKNGWTIIPGSRKEDFKLARLVPAL
jgi:hypothetical protein